MNELEKTHGIVSQIVTQSLIQDACVIIDQAQAAAYFAVNETLIKRNWLLGMRIQHEVLKDKRAEYGEQVVLVLSKALTMRYGMGFTKTNLYNYIGFYQKWPEIFHAVSGKSTDIESIFHATSGKSENVLQAVTAKAPIRLSWTHYRIILQENNKEARNWYEQEAAREMWSTRTLQRNISSQYYHRLLRSANKEVVHDEMQKLTAPLLLRLCGALLRTQWQRPTLCSQVSYLYAYAGRTSSRNRATKRVL